MGKGQVIEDSYLESQLENTVENQKSSLSNVEGQKLPPLEKFKRKKKQRITVQISEDVIERVKNAVYWTPGLTLASLAENAFSKAVNALEKERGGPFPKRKEELKTGRPIK
jgi:predicted DNA binding CopG/RHH family protein